MAYSFVRLCRNAVPVSWTLWIVLMSGLSASVAAQNGSTIAREGLDLQTCGVARASVRSRVMHGTVAPDASWPWHGGLFYQNDYQCGCTLINELFVLTASHCVYSSDTGYKVSEGILRVKLGLQRLSVNASEQMQQYTVLRIISHEKFVPDSHKHDVALLRLNGTVKFNDHIQPVCLDLTESIWVEYLADVLGTVVGWGITEKNRISDELLTAEIPIVRYTDCVERDPNTYGRLIYSGMYCAGLLDGTSPCNGDSGGGMYIFREKRWFLRGVVSFSAIREGTNFCDPFSYVVFMNVPYYAKWIATEVDAARESLMATQPTSFSEKTVVSTRWVVEEESEGSGEHSLRMDTDGKHLAESTGTNPEVRVTLTKRTRTVRCGQNVTLSCARSSNSIVVLRREIRWYKVEHEQRTFLSSDAFLNLHNVHHQHAGEYWCQATGKSGQVYENGMLLVVTDVPMRFQQDGEQRSYAIYDAPKDTGRTASQFSFEMTFKTNESDGLLFHKPPVSDVESWSFSLLLDRSRLAFRMVQPGHTEKVFRSIRLNLVPTRWYTVLVSSYGGQGFLALNGQFLLGFEGHLLQHRLDRYFIANAPELGSSPGLTGCIGRLAVNERELALKRDSREWVGVSLCDECASEACTDDGCPVELQQNSCINDVCSDGRCAQADVSSPENTCNWQPGTFHSDGLRFQQSSYASYRSFLFVALTIDLQFRLHSLQDGIVFHTAEHRRGYGKFITVLLKAGRIELRFTTDAHLNINYMESTVQLETERWHRLQAGYANDYVYLQVDTENEVARSVYGKVFSVQQQLVVFVGGVRWKGFINRHRDVKRGLDGCIKELKLSGVPVDMVDDMVESANILNC